MIKNYHISTCGTVIFNTGLNRQEKELWIRMKKNYELMILILKKYLIPVPNGLGSDLEPIRHHILIRIRKRKIFGSGILEKLNITVLYGCSAYTVRQDIGFKILKPDFYCGKLNK